MDTKPIKNSLSLIVGLIQGSAERMQDNLDDLRKADGSYAVLAALYGLEARMNTLDYQMMLMRQEVARSTRQLEISVGIQAHEEGSHDGTITL